MSTRVMSNRSSDVASLSMLGLSPSATDDDIRAAYKKQCLRHHPDRPDGDTEVFKAIHAAYVKLTSKKTSTSGPPSASAARPRSTTTTTRPSTTQTAGASRFKPATTSGAAWTGNATTSSSSSAKRTSTATSGGAGMRNRSSTTTANRAESYRTNNNSSTTSSGSATTARSPTYSASFLFPLPRVQSPFIFSTVMPGTGGRVTQPYTFETHAAAFGSKIPLRHGDRIKTVVTSSSQSSSVSSSKALMGVIVGVASNGVYWLPDATTNVANKGGNTQPPAAAELLAVTSSLRVTDEHGTRWGATVNSSAVKVLIVQRNVPVVAPASSAPAASSKQHTDPQGSHMYRSTPSPNGISSANSSVDSSSFCGDGSRTPDSCASTTAEDDNDAGFGSRTESTTFASTWNGTTASSFTPTTMSEPAHDQQPSLLTNVVVQEEAKQRAKFMSAIDEWLQQAWWTVRLPQFAPVDKQYNQRHL